MMPVPLRALLLLETRRGWCISCIRTALWKRCEQHLARGFCDFSLIEWKYSGEIDMSAHVLGVVSGRSGLVLMECLLPVVLCH